MSFMHVSVNNGCYIQFRNEKAAVEMNVGMNGYTVDRTEYAGGTEAITALFEQCRKKGLLGQLWEHMCAHPDIYIYEGKGELSEFKLWKYYFYECACASGYARLRSPIRRELEEGMVRRCVTSFDTSHPLRLLILGSSGMLDTVFLTCRLIQAHFKKIELITVEIKPRALKVAEGFKRFIQSYMPEVASYKHVQNVSEIGDTKVQVMCAMDADYLIDPEGYPFGVQGLERVDSKGFSCISAHGNGYFISPQGIDYYSPYLQLRQKPIPWNIYFPDVCLQEKARLRVVVSQEVICAPEGICYLVNQAKNPIDLFCLPTGKKESVGWTFKTCFHGKDVAVHNLSREGMNKQFHLSFLYGGEKAAISSALLKGNVERMVLFTFKTEYPAIDKIWIDE